MKRPPPGGQPDGDDDEPKEMKSPRLICIVPHIGGGVIGLLRNETFPL